MLIHCECNNSLDQFVAHFQKVHKKSLLAEVVGKEVYHQEHWFSLTSGPIAQMVNISPPTYVIIHHCILIYSFIFILWSTWTYASPMNPLLWLLITLHSSCIAIFLNVPGVTTSILNQQYPLMIFVCEWVPVYYHVIITNRSIRK